MPTTKHAKDKSKATSMKSPSHKSSSHKAHATKHHAEKHKSHEPAEDSEEFAEEIELLDATDMDAEKVEAGTVDEGAALGASAEASTNSEEESEETRLDFPYSELVRAYVPKAMNVAEKVATDWKKDGSFMNLGIENPYANMAVSMGLKKAKELEKKLDEKGVFSVVRMGVEVIKQQVNKKK